MFFSFKTKVITSNPPTSLPPKTRGGGMRLAEKLDRTGFKLDANATVRLVRLTLNLGHVEILMKGYKRWSFEA
jgi:hypothetical protein